MNTGTLTILFLILIKVLFVAFIVGLVVGGIMFIKEAFFTEEEKAKIKAMLANNHISIEKKTCACCGEELKATWKACPHCGRTIKEEIVFEAECKNA